MQRIREIIENLNDIKPDDTDLLKQLCIQYPYAGILQLIYTYILYKQENYNFNSQLKLSAATVNSRKKLFSIIHGNLNIQVNKYHNEPVYVQLSEKIDDLPKKNESQSIIWSQLTQEDSNQDYIFKKTDFSNNISDKKTSEIPISLTPSSDTLFDIENKNLPPASEENRSEQIESNESKVEGSILSQEKTIIQNTNLSIPEDKSSDTSNADRSVENQTKSQIEIEEVRRKIREKFGNFSSSKENSNKNTIEDSPSESDSSITLTHPRQRPPESDKDELNTESTESSNEILDHSLTDPQKAQESNIQFINLKSEKDKSLEIQDPHEIINPNHLYTNSQNIKTKISDDLHKNETLDEVKKRALNILEKLNHLKKKYGNVIEKKTEISDISNDQKNIHSVNIDRNYQDNSSSIASDQNIKEIEQDKPSKFESESVKNIADQINPILGDEIEFDLTNEISFKTTEYSKKVETESSDLSTEIEDEDKVGSSETVEIKEAEILFNQEINEQTAEINKENNIESEDIFEKWLSKLSNSKDRMPDPSIHNSNPGVQKSNDKAKGPSKKSEKLKIIDNFLSGNIQIKPKTENKDDREFTDLSVKYAETSPDLMTETLAELFLAQGHTDKAIQAFEILKLKNPEKSSFFARKIQELKKKK